MRINKILVSALVMALSFYSCDYLDVPPINIIQDDAIFNSESGITSYMTTLYYDLPIEDFRYTQQGFNVSGKGQGRYRMYRVRLCVVPAMIFRPSVMELGGAVGIMEKFVG